jgi:hypothetical protein
MTCTYERIRVILGKLCCSYKYFIDKGAIIGFHLSIFFSAYPLLMFDFFYKRDFCIDTQANIKLFTLNRAALLWTRFIYSLKFLSLNSLTLINFTMITSYFFWVNGCMCYKDIYILLLIHWAMYQFHFNVTTNLANKNCKLPSFLQFLTLFLHFLFSIFQLDLLLPTLPHTLYF